MSQPVTYSFEVVPTDGAMFDPFVLDVPAFAQGQAARRAYFTAMSYLRDVADVEDFSVFTFDGNTRGQAVNSGGLA